MDLKLYGQKMQDIAREAGTLVMSYYGTVHEYHYKDDKSFATKADLASEQFISRELCDLIPSAHIIAEEESSSEGSSEYCWVIDPIDGTTNFAHGFPHFAINIALARRDTPIIGVTYNPYFDQMFYAYEGGGAYISGEKMSVSATDLLDRALIDRTSPEDKGHREQSTAHTERIDVATHSYRALGSAALSLAFVAAGWLDATVIQYCYWWDIAAGMVLVKEAGGRVTDESGGVPLPGYAACIASNGRIHDRIWSLWR